MATIHVCDRCGVKLQRPIESYKTDVFITEAKLFVEYNYDLCDTCRELFENYVADFMAYGHNNDEIRKWCNE